VAPARLHDKCVSARPSVVVTVHAGGVFDAARGVGAVAPAASMVGPVAGFRIYD